MTDVIGHPTRRTLNPSTTTLTAAATWTRLVLAAEPLPYSLIVWKNGTRLTENTDYTLKGSTVIFTSSIVSNDVVIDQYVTGQQVGASRFSN